MNMGEENMKNKGIWLLYPVLVLLLMFSLGVPANAADDPMPLPHNFYGSVMTIDGGPASVGTEVEATCAGVVTTEVNPIITTEEGKYGAPGVTGLKLEVTGYIEDGTPIEFYVNGARAECYDVEAQTSSDTYLFKNGEVTELNLTVGEAADETPPTVMSTTPATGELDVAVGEVVSATFSEDIQEGYGFHTIAISPDAGATGYIDGATLTITHDAFAYETIYTVTIPAEAVEDIAGNPNAEYTWSFTVVTEEEAEFDPYTYDTDEDGEFSKAETLVAVDDYSAGNITKDEVLEVVKLYFS